jgi:hypothetical protein
VTKESLGALSKRYGINPKTVAKMEEARFGGGSSDRPEGAKIHQRVT